MSEDGTRELLDTYTGTYDGLRVIDNPGRTTPKALNLGLREAQGDVVLRVDAHARLEPGYIRRCVEALREYDADVACGLMRTVPCGGQSYRTGNRRCIEPSVRRREFVFPHSCLASDVGGYGVLRLLPTGGV